MIFEILIIISAATIFLVLARRLPESDNTNVVTRNLKLNVTKFNIPKFPKINIGLLGKIDFSIIKKIIPEIPSKKKTLGIPGRSLGFKTIADMLLEADQLLKRGDLKGAEDMYIKLASKDPKNPKIYSRLGVIYLQQKNYTDARDAFLAALKVDDKVASRHYNLALAYLNLSTLEKAKVSTRKAIDLDDNPKYQKLLEKLNKKTIKK